MAELTREPKSAEPSGCCEPEAQETCCEPEAKSECCGASEGGCGCSAGEQAEAAGSDAVKEAVRRRYAQAARAAAEEAGAGCGCGSGSGASAEAQADPQGFGAGLYSGAERGELPDAARLASLGCGNPTAVAELHEGESVLDLGSGGGIDVLLSARRVGGSGRAYGLDMTDEMLELARANQRQAGVENAEFLKGSIEEVPLPDDSVDVVISNCVINLSTDKAAVFREAARVLRPGGRLAVADVVADAAVDESKRKDMEEWTGCIAGALTGAEFERGLRDAGFERVEIEPTHRVHEHAASAIVRARMPG